MIVVCSSIFKGLYRDVANGITEGACGPLLIHMDKTKTKEKEAEERVRQRTQDTVIETTTALCWTVVTRNVPDITVETTGSGSMTQEVFMVYTKHFVATLPLNHGPVIFFLDSHGSHWNKYALKFLLDNKVLPFFLASHTSIWSQPNDAGVNKRFHWAIEQACNKVRHTVNVPTIQYCNSNFVNGWRKFLKAECNDLQNVGFNNATNAFVRTGLHPYNPFSEAWTNAIEMIGQAQPADTGTHYETFPNNNRPQLSEAESKIMHDGLGIDELNLHNIAIAYIQSMHILNHWRDEIKTGVSEGEDYINYLNILLPSAKTEAKKLQ